MRKLIKSVLLFTLVTVLTLELIACSTSSPISTPSSGSISIPISTPSSGSTGSRSNSSLTTWGKTAGNTNGDDWATMNYAQKNDIVSGVILTWTNLGHKIDVDAEWFISGLDSFYGSTATNSTNLAQAMSLIGTAGKVIN